MNRSNSLGQHSGSHGGDNWAISYGDMVTLLLAFFVLFFSTSRVTPDITMIVEELKKEFKQVDVPKPKIVWGKQDRQPTSQMNLDEIGVKMNVQGNKVIVEFPKVSFFDTGSYQLTSEGEQALRRFGGVLKKFTSKMRVVVRGYTDNRPVKHTSRRLFKDNLELSSLRAISALRVMNQEGIPYHLLRIGGYGESDKSTEIQPEDILKYDRKIVLVIEELDRTERNLEGLYTNSKENLDQINGKRQMASTVKKGVQEKASVEVKTEEVPNDEVK
jgi:chemotaxis protein MotB